MKLATATSVLFFYSIQDAVRTVAELGYDGIDIWGGRPHVYRQDLSTGELRELRQLIEDCALSVSSFMPAFYRYPHSLSNPNPRVRKDSIEYMCQCVDNAALLGSRIVLVVPDLSLKGQDRADSLNRFIESIDEVAHYSSQYQLKLGIEVLYHDETDLVNNANDALHIINQLGHENLGVVLDSGTLNLSKESPADIFETLNGLVLQVHVSDNDGIKMQQNLIPGEGNYDFPGLVSALKKVGYSGFLSAELSKHYADDPVPALRTTAERLRTWIQAE